MWSLTIKKDGTPFLIYDRSRRYNSYSRGIWETIGRQGNAYTEYACRVNEAAGYLCVDDAEGNVRVLVLEE